ncbi:MAG: hypothetical protein KDA28_04900, partial [Phycisphaerales bacterium]|nr:hypothetical protein [Phycisphaerales bacterium]
MSNEVSATTLRLIRSAQDAPPSATAVARENMAAASLEMMDARWIFAVQVSEALEGGKAALLRPDRRERLLRIANRLGLRHFDASLVIAMVQDGA